MPPLPKNIQPDLLDALGMGPSTAAGLGDKFKIPEKAFRTMKSPKRAFRGGNTGDWRPADSVGENAEWWTDSPVTSNTYNKSNVDTPGVGDSGVRPYSIGGVVDDDGFLVVDAKGASYQHISPDWSPETRQQLKEGLLRYGYTEDAVENKLFRTYYSTDDIVDLAKAAGFPGVRFDNVRDSLDGNVDIEPSTVWAAINKGRRRAQTAAFENPESPDILAALGLTAGGLGAAGAGAAAMSGEDA